MWHVLPPELGQRAHAQGLSWLNPRADSDASLGCELCRVWLWAGTMPGSAQVFAPRSSILCRSRRKQHVFLDSAMGTVLWESQGLL